MPTLYELQQAIMAALLDESAPATEVAQRLGIAEFSAAGIDVHRNNRRSNLQGALRATYPVVERLVGPNFFAYAAQCFIDGHGSHSANLEDYGVEFGAFLRTFKPAQDLPYLADVAALELAIENLLVASTDAAQLFLQSPFPVLRIWQVNQPGWCGDDSVSLDSGADYLRVYRAAGEVLIETLEAADFPTKI